MSEAALSPSCSPPATSLDKPKILVLSGSTSVGKTELSLHLAGLLNGEVISADSAQVYRGLDIGSAKVTREETDAVKHHLVDVAELNAEEDFSVGDFCYLAESNIRDIVSKGRVPLVVGGTGLYILSLLQGGASGAPRSTVETKAMVTRIVEEEDGGNWEKSLARLRELDPVYANSLYPNDWYRLKRALEICLLSGSTVTSFKKELNVEDCPYDAKCLFLTMPRVQLFERIDARCEKIVESGFIQEVISLVKAGRLRAESPAGRSVGYRQVLEYLQAVWGFPGSDGCPYSLKISREDLKKTFHEFLFAYKSRTRHLAHTQFIRFKKAPGFHWLNMAPGGERLSVDVVGKAVADWFLRGTPLPSEWEGRCLLTLSPAENKILKGYSVTHGNPQTFASEEKVLELMANIEECLRS